MMVSCLVSSFRVLIGPRMSSTRWPVFVSIRTLDVLSTVEGGAGSQGDNRRRVVSRTKVDRSRWVWDRRGGGGHGFARAALAPLVRQSTTLADKLIWPRGPDLLVSFSNTSFEKLGAGRLAGHSAAKTSRLRSALRVRVGCIFDVRRTKLRWSWPSCSLVASRQGTLGGVAFENLDHLLHGGVNLGWGWLPEDVGGCSGCCSLLDEVPGAGAFGQELDLVALGCGRGGVGGWKVMHLVVWCRAAIVPPWGPLATFELVEEMPAVFID